MRFIVIVILDLVALTVSAASMIDILRCLRVVQRCEPLQLSPVRTPNSVAQFIVDRVTAYMLKRVSILVIMPSMTEIGRRG
jgi:hypothetical protein